MITPLRKLNPNRLNAASGNMTAKKSNNTAITTRIIPGILFSLKPDVLYSPTSSAKVHTPTNRMVPIAP